MMLLCYCLIHVMCVAAVFPLLPSEAYDAEFEVVQTTGNSTVQYYGSERRIVKQHRVVTVTQRREVGNVVVTTYKVQQQSAEEIVEERNGQCVYLWGSRDFSKLLSMTSIDGARIERLDDLFYQGQPVEVYQFRGILSETISVPPQTLEYRTIRWYFTTSTWLNNDFRGQQLLALYINGTSTSISGVAVPYTLGIHMTYFETGNIDSRGFEVPCRSGAPTVSVYRLPPIVPARPMPALPTAIAATVVVTSTVDRWTFTASLRLDTSKGWGEVHQRHPFRDAAGRHYSTSTYTRGGSRMAYLESRRLATEGFDTTHMTSQLRAYFWPDERSCLRASFQSEVVDRDINSIFLVSGVPLYYGDCMLRSMPCEWWSLTTTNYMVQWYFGMPDALGFRSLMRMVIRGSGTSPFFIHHPFMVTGSVVPANISSACSFFRAEKHHCLASTSLSTYSNVYDFYGMTSLSSDAVLQVPEHCTKSSRLQAFPSNVCGDNTQETTLVVLIVVVSMVATFIVVGTCLYRKPS